MPPTVKGAAAALTSREGGLALGLIGLALGLYGFQRSQQLESHAAARALAKAGQVPDLRLYAMGQPTRAPWRATLT